MALDDPKPAANIRRYLRMSVPRGPVARPLIQPGGATVLLNNCGHRPPFEKPAEWTAQLLAFPQGY